MLYVYRYLPNVYTRSVFLSEYLTRGRGLNRQYLIRGGWLCIKSWNYITLQYRYICVFICPLISFMFQNYYIFSILIVYIDVSTILTVLKSGFQIYKGAKYFSRWGGGGGQIFFKARGCKSPPSSPPKRNPVQDYELTTTQDRSKQLFYSTSYGTWYARLIVTSGIARRCMTS